MRFKKIDSSQCFTLKKLIDLNCRKGFEAPFLCSLVISASVTALLVKACYLSSSVVFKPIQDKIWVVSLHIPSSMLDVY